MKNTIMISNINENKIRLFELCIIIPKMIHSLLLENKTRKIHECKNIFSYHLIMKNTIMISNINENKIRLFELCIIILKMIYFYIIT